MDLPIIIYIVFIMMYRFSEHWAMSRAGSLNRRAQREASALLIAVPYYIIMVGPMLEYFWFEIAPGLIFMISGALFFLGATLVRTRAHHDLGRAFSMYIEKDGESGIVRSGLYAYIRHPLYLANLLLFVACPLFLQSRFTWLVTILGLIGVLKRIRVEEQFLREQAEEYPEYESETWALIPGLY